MRTVALKNEIFSGILHDVDLLPDHSGNYTIHYHFVLLDADVNGEKCTIREAELGIGTRLDVENPVVDLKQEKKDLYTQYRLYSKLSKEHPDQIAADGLTNKELQCCYHKLIAELDHIETALLSEIREQIYDRFSVNEAGMITDVKIENIRIAPFNRMKMSKKINAVKLN